MTATDRQILIDNRRRSYTSTAFPGSPRWMAMIQDEQALAAFDAAHPEIKAEMDRQIEERDAARRAADQADPNYADRILGM